MNFRQFVRDYFTFTRNERKGIVVLLVIIFVLAVANKMIFYFEKPAKLDEALFDSAKHELAAYGDSINTDISKPNLKSNRENNKGKTPFVRYGGSEGGGSVEDATSKQLFKFDPNTCSDEEFKRLGFSDKQTDVIRRYIDRGAAFKNKDDFFRIRIITEKQKQILSPWILIPETSLKPIPGKINETDLSIEINSADSVALEKLPGIGKYLSKRIVRYRDLLGGFYSIDQLKEVYGLNESTISQIEKDIRIDRSGVKKIDLNFGDVSDLARHPYIKRPLAVKIVKFRAKYGSISDLSVLKDSMIFTEEEYVRLKPYF